MTQVRLSMFLALLLAVGTSCLGCPYVKRCADSPVSPTDKVGIKACFNDSLATDCFTTASAPFYACQCACDRCSSPPLENCEETCFPSTTTTGMTTTSPSQTARLFAIGGRNADSFRLQSVDMYDCSTSSWTKAADLPSPTSYLGAALLNGMIYAVGGRSQGTTAAVLVYDPKQNTWSSAPSMATPRYGHGVVQLAGRIYAIGGFAEVQRLRSAESFDQQTNKWNKIADMSVERGYTAAAVLGDRVYAIGGNNATHLNSVEAYNPKTGSWSSVAPMNTDRSHLCAASVGDILYAIGGGNRYSGFLKSVEAYDAKSNKWSFVAEMSTPRWGCCALSLSGLLYVLGGANGSVYLNTMEEYNPKTNTWRLLPTRMPTARWEFGAALEVEKSKAIVASFPSFILFSFLLSFSFLLEVLP